jgi:hypothetical protein
LFCGIFSRDPPTATQDEGGSRTIETPTDAAPTSATLSAPNVVEPPSSVQNASLATTTPHVERGSSSKTIGHPPLLPAAVVNSSFTQTDDANLASTLRPLTSTPGNVEPYSSLVVQKKNPFLESQPEDQFNQAVNFVYKIKVSLKKLTVCNFAEPDQKDILANIITDILTLIS